MGTPRGYINMYWQILEQGMVEGVFRQIDAFVMANTFALMFATVALRRWNLKGCSLERTTDALVDFVVTSLLSTGRPVEHERAVPT